MYYRKIKTFQEDIVATLPKTLLFYTPDDILDQSLSTNELQLRYSVRLEILHNEFYTNRLLLRNGHIDDGTLLATSYEVLLMVTTAWTNIDRFSAMRANMGWLVRFDCSLCNRLYRIG